MNIDELLSAQEDRSHRLEYGVKIMSNMEVGMKISTIAEEREKNPIVIYHANCADGFAAAWVFWSFYKDQKALFPDINGALEFHPGVYGKVPPDVAGRVVYLVDFSYKKEIVEKMLESAKHIYLIDHHKTAIEDLKDTWRFPNFTAYTDLERSGAMLAWDFIYNGEPIDESGEHLGTINKDDPMYKHPPRLLEHIQDRDLWRFKLPLTREIQAEVFSHEYTFENYDRLMKMDTLDLVNSASAGAAILRKMDKDIKELLNVCQRTMVIGDTTVPVASLPYTFSSDAGHIMATNWKEGKEFAACYWDTADKRIFSLRSASNGMDVSEIAKSYGGGGHRNAAGFSVDRGHELARG